MSEEKDENKTTIISEVVSVVCEVVDVYIVGRPSKYKPEYCEMMEQYFDIEPYREVTLNRFKKNGDCEEFIAKVPNALPTVEGFCKLIKIHKDTFYEWCKVHDEFSDSHKKAMVYQSEILIQNGLASNYHPVFAIFAAKNLIGWTDKKEINNNTTITHKKLEDFLVPTNKPALPDNSENKKLVDFQTHKQNKI